MSLSSLLTQGGVWAVGTAAVIAFVEGLFGRGGKRADAAAKLAEAESKKNERWFREAGEAYERLEGECTRCQGELRRLRIAFYDLLDDLQDLDAEDTHALKAQVRAAARKARTIVDWEQFRRDDE